MPEEAKNFIVKFFIITINMFQKSTIMLIESLLICKDSFWSDMSLDPDVEKVYFQDESISFNLKMSRK